MQSVPKIQMLENSIRDIARKTIFQVKKKSELGKYFFVCIYSFIIL